MRDAPFSIRKGGSGRLSPFGGENFHLFSVAIEIMLTAGLDGQRFRSCVAYLAVISCTIFEIQLFRVVSIQ